MRTSESITIFLTCQPKGKFGDHGVSLGEIQAKLLAKVEELTLYMIEADKRNNRIEHENRELKSRLARLEARAER